MKIIKYIIINALLLVLLINVADFCIAVFHVQYTWMYKNTKDSKIAAYLKNYKHIHCYSSMYTSYNNFMFDKYLEAGKPYDSDGFRPIENRQADKSIIIFGCSYPYGQSLSNNETFSYNLGKALPNYRIFNRAKGGWTTSHMLYQLENKDFSKTDISNVKYVIYVFIADHIIRNYNSYQTCYTPYYRLDKNQNLVYQKHTLKHFKTPITSFFNYYTRSFNDCFVRKCTNKKNYKVLLTKKEIEQAKARTELLFPDAKFVVLRYDNGDNEPYNWMFDELKKNLIVVELSDISNVDYLENLDYKCRDNFHPNAKAWVEITPLFVKQLQARGYLKD